MRFDEGGVKGIKQEKNVAYNKTLHEKVKKSVLKTNRRALGKLS